MMLSDFGRGAGRFICECGRFYDWIDGCTHCKQERMKPLMARKMALNKLNGIPNKAAKKKGTKGIYFKTCQYVF